MSVLVKIILDDLEIEVDPRLTQIGTSEGGGVEVPRVFNNEGRCSAGKCRVS
jgi:NADH-quinone oxidoreductase subunit G